ncbi:hypothetical protein OROMI_027667 [Orobanche minor]
MKEITPSSSSSMEESKKNPDYGQTINVYTKKVGELEFIDKVGVEVETEIETENMEVDENDVYSDQSEDEDYKEYASSGDEILDDIIFNENIDKDVEWTGLDATQGVANSDNGEESSTDSDDVELSESDFDSIASSEASDDDEERVHNMSFRKSHLKDPVFFMEQIFSTKALFKDVIKMHSVKTGRALGFKKNDSRRIYARCKMEGCDWHINALK